MENLPRWIFTSVAWHFKEIADDNNIPLFIEGIDERESEDSEQDHVELRLTGPIIKEVSKDYYTFDTVVNFLVTNLMSMSGDNAYKIIDWCGILAYEMNKPLPIYKYGSGPDDDDSLIKCMQVKKNKSSSVKIFHFGQIDKTSRIRQSEIDASYEMDVKLNEV